LLIVLIIISIYSIETIVYEYNQLFIFVIL